MPPLIPGPPGGAWIDRARPIAAYSADHAVEGEPEENQVT